MRPDATDGNILGGERLHALLCGGADHDAELNSELQRLRRERIDRPVIFVGAGTCGLGAGAGKVLTAVRAHLAAGGIDADVVETGCIGLCSEEPLLEVQLPGRARAVFSRVKPQDAPGILDAMLSGTVPTAHFLGQHGPEGLRRWDGLAALADHPFFAGQTRWVLRNCGLIDPGSLEESLAWGGYRGLAKALRTQTPAEVCAEVERSGLRGRGGGGFPTGRKWTFALNTAADQRYMICNADEGDPGAFMDRAVIEGDPHRVLEGLALAAYAIGATKAYIYIRAEYPLAIRRLRAAIAQAETRGLLGDDILGSGFDLKVVIKMGAGAFVCGEETALIHSIEGRRGMPRPRPPFPAVSGLFGKPSVINNVETLANVPELVERGADWFSSLGTAGSKGTKVFALSGKVARTGLVEVAMGTSVREIVFGAGGGIPGGKAYKAVQIGGPSGGCIPEQHLDILVDYESLKTVGAMMGSGGLVVMDEDTCMVDVARFFMDFIQRESCGKCIPCREGTKHLRDILDAIVRGRRHESGADALARFKGVTYLPRLAEVIRETSLCGLGMTAPNPVLSTMRWFPEEYEAHIYERRCPAKVCRDLLTFDIDTGLCKGCTLCARVCPAGAIVGVKKQPHLIVHDKCIACGACLEACKFDAVEVC
ncbi:MAG: NADH-ubiquinone oxidoreductase-F iron-sulfur binding region domain-containing protein [Candidatus Latescibacteria bacterium]|nr:NADH-ubiquinone oxidoreductase-F iron-sulfur binding region domain-containing protein [Candidatus Latescibacterota bacterium]